MKRYFCFFFFFVLVMSLSVYPQTSDTDTNIPALENFHEIIYPIWHTAYPSKDYAALKSFVPEVNEKAALIYEVKLPGILREKQERWDKGIKEFKASVDEYNTQAKGDNNAALLLAAEKLHSNYEALVRIIRPVLKEVEDFHKVLYVIYHEYLPNKNYEKISSLTDELLTTADAITKAKLPKKFEPKSADIKNAADGLVTSVKNLKNTFGDKDKIPAAVEKMHSNYQKLETLF